jgi:hypothetical protein
LSPLRLTCLNILFLPQETGQYTLWEIMTKLGDMAPAQPPAPSPSFVLANSEVYGMSVSLNQASSNSVSLTANANPAIVNTSVTLTATVVGNVPSGTVTFTDNGANIGNASVVNGQATLSHTFTATGAHAIVASYGGDYHDRAASGSMSLNIMTAAQYQSYLATINAIIDELLLSD